jgi:hypothetical protein
MKHIFVIFVSQFKYYICFVFFLCVAAATAKEQQLIHTPKSGSPERQAICDAARAFVLGKYVNAALTQPIVFKIEHISVQEPYCNFEAIPLFKDQRRQLHQQRVHG